ncbi:hypothetical protein JCM17846_10620 [Iodidimonas nitroreducens]|uniref:Uncharacterized protein n=1 Tax=Iodidimonas nitroreducens TaxID=1236968 RepID=A0A5A7N7M0_9PROT|nr:PA domain-containing protein [Iodidimonas nitroreducens]GER03380.1 hypothetical protein JCM17846_10620 [Iodidimonas nitroreducens]
MLKAWLLGAGLLVLAGCDQTGDQTGGQNGNQALDQNAMASSLHQYTATLASDEFAGRAPASEGEEKTIGFLEQHFRALGLKPGFGDSYVQPVPLAEITVNPKGGRFHAAFTKEGEALGMGYGSQILAWSLREEPEITVEGSEVVFVGYGINAPDYGWNDYEGIDVRGKTVLMLINDPGYASGDPAIFNGKAMTYYGRWTYKFEEAARQGAAAAILIHQKDPAGYPWDVVQSSWSGPQFSLVSADKGQSRVAVEAWISLAAATALLQRGDLTLDEAQALALSPDFKATPLPVTFSARLESTVRHTTSHNVIAVREGSSVPDEALIYMAHWDHLGTDPT